jgi:hypothetical protein
MSTFVISNKTTQILCKFTGGPKARDWEISSAHSQFFLERTLDHQRDTIHLNQVACLEDPHGVIVGAGLPPIAEAARLPIAPRRYSAAGRRANVSFARAITSLRKKNTARLFFSAGSWAIRHNKWPAITCNAAIAASQIVCRWRGGSRKPDGDVGSN